MPDDLAVKFMAGSTDMVEGWLAPYGGPEALGGKDLHGEWFSERTDFALDWFADWQRPLLFQHGLDDAVKTDVVGRISVTKREKGLWMQAQLDAASEYHAEIAALVADGALGASSGSVAHLVQRDRKSGEVVRWPLIEGSLTPTPANPDASVGYAIKSADAVLHLAVIGTETPEAMTDEVILDAVKEGRRNSTTDMSHIQSAHDAMVALGATCDMPATASKSDAVAEPEPAATPLLGVKVAEPAANIDALRDLYSAYAVKVAQDLLRT